MNEVLRYHIHEELCRDLSRSPNHRGPAIQSAILSPGARSVSLRIFEIEVEVPDLRPWDKNAYVKVSIGSKPVSRTPSTSVAPEKIAWNFLDILVIAEEKSFRCEYLVLECFTEREVSEPTLLCEFRISLSDALQIGNINNRIVLTGSGTNLLYGDFKIHCFVSADDEQHYQIADAETHRSIAGNLQSEESIEHTKPKLSKPIILQQQKSLNSLVSEMRGDVAFFRKALLAQIENTDVSPQGHSVEKNLTEAYFNTYIFHSSNSFCRHCPHSVPSRAILK